MAKTASGIWRRLLFASDFSDAAHAATQEVCAVASRLGAQVTLANVQPSSVRTWMSSKLEERHRLDRLDLIAERFHEQGVSTETRVITLPDIGRALVDLSATENADVVFLAGSEPTLRLRRSTVISVLRHSTRPVWVSKPRGPLPRRIACGVDGSESSCRALRLAVQLRDAFDTQLTAVYAVGNPEFNPLGMTDAEQDALTAAHRARAVEQIQDFVAACGVQDVDIRCISGPPVAVLKAFVMEEEVDLLLLGRTGVRGVRRLVLGSTTEELAQKPVCSVIVQGEAGEPDLMGR